MALTKVIGNGLGAVTQDGAATFNEGSADVDFRIESNGNTHMLFVQAGSDCLGIKTTSPNDYYADDLVLTAPDEGGMTIVTGTAERAYLAFADGTSGVGRYRGYISYDHNGDTLYLGANGSGQLLIDSTGAVTKPNQPAFCVTPTNNQTNFSTGSFITIVFDNERFDQNADFASNTFTAPVTGRYQLDAQIVMSQIDSAADYYQLHMNTSNKAYNFIFDPDYGQDNVWHTISISVCADMDANDTVLMRILQSGGSAQTDIAGESHFSGYLVA